MQHGDLQVSAMGRGGVTRPAALGLALATALAPMPAPARPGPVLAVAPAAREAVVVLPLTPTQGGLDERLARILDERVADGLRRGQFAVVTADEVRARVPAGACEAACLREIGAATGARYLVRTEVAVEGRDYNLKLVLLRADTGAPVVTSADLCEICGHEELADRVGDVASALRRKLGAAVEPPPRLRVLTRPDGSEVLIDGVHVGDTPLDITVAAGEHDLVIQRPGFVAHRRRLRLSDGATETISAALGPLPAPAAAPQRRLAPIGWAALALGLASTATGTGLIAVDERPILRDCSGVNVDPAGHCKWRHDTLAGGVVLTIVGVAAVALGAALLGVDRQRSKRSPARARVLLHTSGLGLRF
ncbi:MAG: PEGA domain-containing protein [Myxococcales bacterium]|nr:PEGA domain-containing protein [Myxococcales bacterium]